MQAIDSDYQTQREKIELDGTAISNQYHLESYQEQLSEYTYLISSIETGKSTFPANDTNSCKYLYDDYVNCLSELPTYDKTMLEGYTYYKQSVQNDADMFDTSRDSFTNHKNF